MLLECIQKLCDFEKHFSDKDRRIGGTEQYLKEAPDKPNFKAYRLLRLLHLLDPVNGVTGPEIDALLEFGLSRTRTVFWTAPRAAAFRPQDTELQVRVARHFVFLDDTTRPDRKLVAEGYLPFVERAYRGSPPGAVKWEMAALLGHVLRVADLMLDLDTWQTTRDNQRVSLTPTALRLLEVLMRASPRLVRRGELETAIWGDHPPDSEALRTHIHALRAAIDKPFGTPLLHTVPTMGYRLIAPDTA